MIKKSSTGKIGGFDFSKRTTPKYKRIKPLEKNIKTGEYLNTTTHDIYKEDGEEDRYAITQSHKRECDIYEILANCVATGTLDQLGDTKNQTYTDITEIPNNISETYEKIPNKEEIENLKNEYKELQKALKQLEIENTQEKGKEE